MWASVYCDSYNTHLMGSPQRALSASSGPDSEYKMLSIISILYQGATKHAGPTGNSSINLGARVNGGRLWIFFTKDSFSLSESARKCRNCFSKQKR